MQTKSFDVKGMSCGHCKASVEGALEKIAGVTSVEVNLETGKVDVTFDSSKVSPEAMSEAIEEQGYDVVA